nr:PAS domain-containing sensor histidine kinase [uncultured Pseudodesulfovibrio sp.]
MKSWKSSRNPADEKPDPVNEREKLIGLGKRSISKSYYPELKNRLDELEQFRALLDRVNDAIFVVDADTGITLDISGSTATMLGCDAEMLVGKSFKSVLPEHIQRYAANLFHNETKTLSLETSFSQPESPDKPPVPVELTIQLVTFQGSRRAIIVARDISERKINEERLKKSHAQLEIRVRERTRELNRANQAKSEFLAIVSHELRTPLTSILGFAKINRKKLVNKIFPFVTPDAPPHVHKEMERVKRNLDIITSEGNRLTALINDVLDLAKLEANKVEFNFAPINPQEFIHRSVEATASLFKESNLALLLELEPNLPTVNGDLDRLIQVMVNLISNGVKFTPRGSLTCRARRLDNNVRISITDTGIGMPQSTLDTIFEKFTQVQEGSSDRPRGTGLGLSICRHIINGHRGHIWAESHPDKGSKFIFTLPIADSRK